MPTEIAQSFKLQLNDMYAVLLEVSPALADTPWRPGGWTRKQLVGHLLDSAANNRQRFVRAAIDGTYTGPFYAQDSWIIAHGYAEQSWEDLLRWWLAESEILMAVVDRIPEDKLSAMCHVGDDEPVTLQFLIGDYLRHHLHHLAQITSGV
jgi:Mycothiol maleylpyruvate isomerase N-terminal domain.